METIWVDRPALEARIPLSASPHFHRAVLSQLCPNEPWEAMFFEKPPGRLQAAAHQLKRDGLASGLWVASSVVPETLKGYLP